MDYSASDTTPFTVSLQHLDGRAELLVAGELDIATIGSLLAAVDALIADGHRDVWLNLSPLAFIDAAGVGGLANVHQRLLELGGHLRLTGVHGMPQRILGICGLLHLVSSQSPSSTANASPAAGNTPRA